MKQEINRDWAEALALQALAYIISGPALYGRFFDLTGVNETDLQPPRILDTDFLAAVMEFILADEGCLLDFCAMAVISPADPARAHILLTDGKRAE